MNYFEKLKWDKKSIAFKFTFFVIILVIVQSILLISALIVGGVLKEVQENAFQSFDEKVNYQKDYIMKEMSNRWTNVEPYLQEISALLPLDEQAVMDDYFEASTPALISMLRTTMTNGAFLILANTDSSDQHEALYLRDHDAYLNDGLNKDLYCVAGPSQICQALKIPFDDNWGYQLTLTDENRAFYDQPAAHAHLSTNSKLLGYWSKPFKLAPTGVSIITYSLPIYDNKHVFRGIVGVELLLDQFTEVLPGKDLLARDSISYLIGYQEPDEDTISPLITNGALQERILQTDTAFQLETVNEAQSIHILGNPKISDTLYAKIEPIRMYAHNTPFEQEQWYLVGLMTEHKLLGFVHKIKNILLLSLISSIFIGGIASYFVSHIFTKPIVKLANQVHASDLTTEYTLNRTGLTEIDNLSQAIEIANKNFIDSTMKLSQIINLMNVPIGAFEIKANDEKVFATEQLKQILLFEDEEASRLFTNKTAFNQRVEEIMQHAEPEEQNVYKISESPEKWVRINLITDAEKTLGTVIDVTAEILDKIQIKFDRDHDVLTNIFNRGAYKRAVNAILQTHTSKASACIMFDLDSLKQINDTFGHKWGDYYIAKTAEHLKLFQRYGGVVGRLSGDEFSVFLYDFESQDEIRALVQNFYETLEQNPLKFPMEVRPIRISGGLYWLEKDVPAVYEDMMQKADALLYFAKRTKKGTLLERELTDIV